MASARVLARKRFAAEVLDKDYVENLKIRAKGGDLAPAVEVLLLHYLLGKPTDEVEHIESGNDLADMGTADLLAAAQEIEAMLKERVSQDMMTPGPSQPEVDKTRTH
jgi:hypothetical protein